MAQPYYRAIAISIHLNSQIRQRSFHAVLNDLLIFFLACFTPSGRAISSVRFGARSAKKFCRN